MMGRIELKLRQKLATLWVSAKQWPYTLVLAFSLIFLIGHILVHSVSSSPETILDFRIVSFQARTLLNWTGRLSASIGGAYLTSIAVDGVFRSQERERQKQTQKIALSELSDKLGKQKSLIIHMYVSAATELPDEDEVTNFKELVESDEFEEIRLLDFSGSSSLSNKYAKTWLEQFQTNQDNICETIDSINKRYAHVMEPEILEDLHVLSNDGFINRILVFSNIPNENDYLSALLHVTDYVAFLQYIDRLSLVCEKCDVPFEAHSVDILHKEKRIFKLGKDRIQDQSIETTLEEYREEIDHSSSGISPGSEGRTDGP